MNEFTGRDRQCSGVKQEGSTAALRPASYLFEMGSTDQALLQKILNSFTDAVAVINPEMTIIGANQGQEKTYGVPWAGRKCYEALQDAQEPCLNCPGIKAFQDKQSHTAVIQDRNGRNLEVQIIPIMDYHGEVEGIVEHVRDTGQLFSTANRDWYEPEFKQVFQQSADGMYLIDGEGIILDWNQSMERITLNRSADVVGRYILDVRFQLIAPENRNKQDFDEIGKTLLERLKKGDTFWFGRRNINEILLADGTTKTIHECMIPMRTARGVISCGIFRDVTELSMIRRQAEESQTLYQAIFENTGTAMVIIEEDGTIIMGNREITRCSGYRKGELVRKRKCFDFVFGSDWEKVYAFHHQRRRDPESAPSSYELRIVAADGSILDCGVTVAMIPGTRRSIASIINRSEEKRMERNLRRSKDRYKSLVENVSEAIFNVDMHGYFTYISPVITKLFGYAPREWVGKSFGIFVDPQDLPGLLRDFDKAIGGDSETKEFRIVDKQGNTRYARVSSQVMIEDGQPSGINGILADITERKIMEDQLRFLSLHDTLTGLHNRTYFEQEMRRLDNGRHPFTGLIMCDVDGLKLVNDTLGHDAGDELLAEAAKLIAKCFRESDVIARVGGDEFAVLLPYSHRTVVERGCRRIRESVAQYNAENDRLPISISVGFATRDNISVGMDELYREADNAMYREKLHSSRSARSAIVSTLMKALEARDFITEGHGERLQRIVEEIGVALGLPDGSISDLRLLAQFHDIGKVGIPDRILFKPARLTPKEYEEMKRHCEIGHRIAQAAADLQPIADWIWKHHEWWNGNGYPLGLSGETIPLECRILAIADAYDAMTCDRPYRIAMDHDAALTELKRCAGTQFDPTLVDVFCQVFSEPAYDG